MGWFCEHYTFAPACWHCRMRGGKKRKWENAGKRGNGRGWLLGRKRWHTAVPVHFCNFASAHTRDRHLLYCNPLFFIPDDVHNNTRLFHSQNPHPVSYTSRPNGHPPSMRRESSANTRRPSGVIFSALTSPRASDKTASRATHRRHSTRRLRVPDLLGHLPFRTRGCMSVCIF